MKVFSVEDATDFGVFKSANPAVGRHFCNGGLLLEPTGYYSKMMTGDDDSSNGSHRKIRG
jgi:hypothetical protein